MTYLQTRRLFAVLPFFLASLAQAHAPAAQTAEEKAVDEAVMGARKAIQTAVLAKDTQRLETLYTPAFTHTHGSGKVDGRAERIVSLLTADPTVEMAPVENWVLASYGGDTAIARGTAPILNRKENQYYQFRWIQVYVKGGDGWQMAASQATRLSNPPVPATDPSATALMQIGTKPANPPSSSAR